MKYDQSVLEARISKLLCDFAGQNNLDISAISINVIPTKIINDDKNIIDGFTCCVVYETEPYSTINDLK